MKLTLQEAFQLADAIMTLYDDETSTMKPGCDCGCGGDSYDWDEHDGNVYEAKHVLKELGVIIDNT